MLWANETSYLDTESYSANLQGFTEGHLKSLCYTDLVAQRCRLAMKEAGIKLNSDAFAKKLKSGWWVENDSLQKITYKVIGKNKDGTDRKRPVSIYSSRNYLEDFLKNRTYAMPSRTALKSLARALGYRSERYWLEVQSGQRDDKNKRKDMFDLLPHLAPGFNLNHGLDHFLEAYNFVRFTPPSNYRLTKEIYQSPRIKLLFKEKAKEQVALDKARKADSKRTEEERTHKIKDRAKALKSFFNVSKWSKTA